MPTLDDLAPREHLRVACVGECMVELSSLDLSGGDAKVAVAGDTLNTAIYFARETSREKVAISYVTLLGEGVLSEQMVRAIAAEGVDCSLIGRHPDRQPGIYLVERDARGERFFRYWRSESAARRLFSNGFPALDMLADFDLVYLSGISLAILPPERRKALIDACAALRSSGTVIAFDSNHRPRLWDSPDEARNAMDAMWRVTDIGFPSLEDLRALHGEMSAEQALRQLSELGVGEIVLRDGARGTTTRCKGQPDMQLQPMAVEVVDSIAAGDSYNAAYLASRLRAQTVAEAMRFAQNLAEQVLAFRGAILPPRTSR